EARPVVGAAGDVEVPGAHPGVDGDAGRLGDGDDQAPCPDRRAYDARDPARTRARVAEVALELSGGEPGVRWRLGGGRGPDRPVAEAAAELQVGRDRHGGDGRAQEAEDDEPGGSAPCRRADDGETADDDEGGERALPGEDTGHDESGERGGA